MPKIRCNHCGYVWNTNSKMMNVSCSSCLQKVNVKTNIITDFEEFEDGDIRDGIV